MQFAFYYAPRSHIGQLLKLLRFAAIILSLTVLVTATASSQVFHIAAPASGDTFETKSPTTVQPPLLSPTPPVNQPVLHLINGDSAQANCSTLINPTSFVGILLSPRSPSTFMPPPSPPFTFRLRKKSPPNNRRKNLLPAIMTIPSNSSAAMFSSVHYRT